MMVALLLVALVVIEQADSKSICKHKKEFIFSVNYHTGGKMGEFQVAGCAGTSPVLEIQRGVTYTFIQHDISNWMHPLGLAYYPDGHHGDLIITKNTQRILIIKHLCGCKQTQESSSHCLC